MKKTFAYGKTIILGEHFVVHGFPAIAAALQLKTEASVNFNNSEGLIFIDHRPKAPSFVSNKTVEYCQMLENIVSYLKIERRDFDITVTGNLTVTCGGIGASAACAVSIIKAFNQYLNLNLNNNEINDAAIFAESAVHGSPSGIDNTAAVFGGMFEYSKQFGAKPISVKKPIQILLVDSGKQTDTKKLILKVKRFLGDEPERAMDVFNQYKSIVNQGLMALNSSDLGMLGKCMNENHALLREIGISCPELDFVVDKALENGALGAKLTGSGGGGLALILMPEDFKIQNKITELFKSSGFFTIKTDLI